MRTEDGRILPDPDIGVMRAMARGFRCRCPACGEGRAFGRFLKVVDRCEACGTELHHHRADDLPPYVVIFIVGHVIGYGILVAEMDFVTPLWVHLTLWPTLTLVMAFLLMQPVKGAVVGLQLALGLGGFARTAQPNQETVSDTGDRDPLHREARQRGA